MLAVAPRFCMAVVADNTDELPNTGYLVKASAARRQQPPDGLLNWRKLPMDLVISSCHNAASVGHKEVCARRDIYQFGVFTGRSMRAISHYLKSAQPAPIPFRRMWGFDSFSGLPPESDDESLKDKQYRKAMSSTYQAGMFNAADILQTHSYSALTRQLEDYIADPRVGWVRGFYNVSLTAALRDERGMAPALYVDLDADMYSSTMQNLDWLFRSNLIREPRQSAAGTILGYDDWAYSGAGGQRRAHQEAAVRYNVTFRNLKCCCKAACFEVLSFGSSK